jgi:NADPH:quinone reductase-like Zn-dependent oxidoreductase
MTLQFSQTATMPAWICQGYGGPEVLALAERPKPRPKDHELLIRIHATTVSSGDARIRSQSMPRGFALLGRLIFGLRAPRQPILGSECAGVVEAVGQLVTNFKPGDAVIAFSGSGMGCHAHYVAMNVTKAAVVPKPANLSFAEAASLAFGGTTALHFLRRAKLAAGETILVIGASGAVGQAMVQLAKLQGARVTAVTSARNADLVRSLGADSVIDYAQQDVTTAGATYDIIADTVGASRFAHCLPVLNEHGRYLGVAADLAGMLARPAGTKRSITGPAPERREDVQELADLASAGILKPVIDSVYDFTRLPEAHARVDSGRKTGSAVVTMVL